MKLKLPTHNETTGDEFANRAEALSWVAQGMIRRWIFLGVITVLTFTTWLYAVIRLGAGLGAGPQALITWWNVWASYLALVIESVVGIGMFHMTKREAVLLREVRRLADLSVRIAEDIERRQLGE